MLRTRRERTAYFEPWLGALSPSAPILGAFEAYVGQYRGQPVWLLWRKHEGELDRTGRLWIAMATGHPLDGSIATQDVLRHRPPVHDAEFFDVFHAAISPDGVAPLALDTPATRAHVQRVFRGGGQARILLTEGYLSTPADFIEPSLPVAFRTPSPEEVHALVEGVAHLTERFRAAVETRYSEIARTQGEAAARAWYEGARAASEETRARTARGRAMLTAARMGCVALTLLLIGIAFFWFLPAP